MNKSRRETNFSYEKQETHVLNDEELGRPREGTNGTYVSKPSSMLKSRITGYS